MPRSYKGVVDFVEILEGSGGWADLGGSLGVTSSTYVYYIYFIYMQLHLQYIYIYIQ